MAQEVELDDRVRLCAIFLRQRRHGIRCRHHHQHPVDRRNQDFLPRGQSVDELRVRPEQGIHRQPELRRQRPERVTAEGVVMNDIAMLLAGRR